MKTITAFATTAGACAFVAVAIATPASAKPGIHLNGPSLDGQQIALPGRPRDTSEAAAGGDGIVLNGPALDGQQVALPGGPSNDEVNGLPDKGPALDGQKIALPAWAGGDHEVALGCPASVCGVNGPSLDGRRVALPVQGRG